MTILLRVGQVLKLQRRPVVVDPHAEYEEIGVRSFGKGIFHKGPVSGVELGNKRVFRIQPGDLVLSNVFAWEGAVAAATHSEAGKIGSHRFMTYTPVDNQVDTNWAAWFFRSEPGLELIGSASPGSAGRNRTLAIDRFENLMIPLPPIDQQRQTASRLDTVAEAQDAVRTLIQRSDALSVALRSALTSQPPDSTGEWKRVPLSDVLTLNVNESLVDGTADYQMAGVYSFGRGLFERGELSGAKTSYQRLNRLAAGQIVMSRLKAWEGALALVPREFDGWFLSPEFPTFDVNREVAYPAFMGVLLTSDGFWSRLRGESRGLGARKERVSAATLLAMEVDLPSIERQEALSRPFEAMSSTSRKAAARNSRIDALLPAALHAEFGNLS